MTNRGGQTLTTVCSQLAEDVGHVKLDCALRDPQGPGDLLVREATQGQLQNLALARREIQLGQELVTSQPISLPDILCQDAARGPKPPSLDGFHGCDEFF